MISQIRRLSIAALGSSFAAGPSTEPLVHFAAGRSKKNYAHLLADKLDAELTDLTVSGATLLDVLNQDQSVVGSNALRPQAPQIPEETTIVTLTAGGNDLNYMGGMMKESQDALNNQMQVSTSTELTAVPEISQGKLCSRVTNVLNAIHIKAPQATVYLVEYLSVIGKHSKQSSELPLPEQRIAKYGELAHMLVQAYREAARRANLESGRNWVEIVRVAEKSKAHAVGSPDPWVVGFWTAAQHKTAAYHPNAKGHEAVADMLFEQIKGRVEEFNVGMKS